jgi:hypothetical protein
MGRQQGLAFYQHLLLLKVFGIFNGGELLERLVLYTPHIHIQAYNTIKIRNSTPNYSTHQNECMDIKNAKMDLKHAFYISMAKTSCSGFSARKLNLQGPICKKLRAKTRLCLNIRSTVQKDHTGPQV